MNWTTEADIHRQLQRLWQRGTILRALVALGADFPARLRLHAPTVRELSAQFAQADEWVRMLRQVPHIRLTWRAVRSRVQGSAELPAELWVDTPQAAIHSLNLWDDANSFLAMEAETRAILPELLPWLLAHPHRALQAQAVWQRALRVAQWKRNHPDATPIYLRQLDLPGIDTKFIEANTALLREMFEQVCPSDLEKPGSSDFCARYGFLQEPTRVRFRLLDAATNFADLPGCPDVELDVESFAALRLDVTCVFILENKTTYLVFPPVTRAIAIFGAGYGLQALQAAVWLKQVRIVYWGDIDTHGFAILSQMRKFLPHAESMLMDQATLLALRDSWTTEPVQTYTSLPRLSAAEQSLLTALQSQHFGEQVRLEQEKVPASFIRAALQMVQGKTPESDA